MTESIKKHMWVLPVLWMAVIFLFSHQPGDESAELSSGITGFIIRVFDLFNFEADGLKLHGIVRAMAHFTIFFILGALWYMALRARDISRNKAGMLALSICFLYALFDEGHQYFVPGRICDIRDVLIDSFGAGTAILLPRLPRAFKKRAII